MTVPFGMPANMKHRATGLRIVNVAMRRILGLPFPTPLSSRLMLLYLTGRKTGKSYRQPVSYVRDGETLLTPGGGKWTLNLQAGRPERIRLRGHDQMAFPDVVSDIEEVDYLLMKMVAANPMLKRFVPIPRAASGHFDQQRLNVAVEQGFCIVRWRPAQEA